MSGGEDGLIDAIYAAALQQSRWTEVLAAFGRNFDGESVTLEVHQKQRGELLFFEGHCVEPETLAAYSSHFVNVCPRVPEAVRHGAGYVGYDYAFYTERDISRSEFYQDFLAPRGMCYFVSSHLISDSSRFGVLAVHRSQRAGHVTEEHLSAMRRLTPHLQRAVEVGARLARADLLSRSLFESLARFRAGAVLLDRALRVRFVNPAAEAMLASAGVLSCREGQLRGRDARDDGRLRSCLAAAVSKAAGDATLVLGDGSGPTLTLSICSLPSAAVQHELFSAIDEPIAAAIVLFDVVEPRRASAALLTRGLTPAEVRLAIALAQGETLAQQAERLRLSPNTLRTHLARLRHKLGVHTQAEVVRAVLMALPAAV